MLGVAGALVMRAASAPAAPAARAPLAMRSLRTGRTSRVRMQEAVPLVEAEAPPAPTQLPKIKTMRVGDGTLAGDMNFDPLGFSDSPESLAWYREAEIRHARLAMLAALGWPVSELTNFGSLLTPDGRAPALLNGGLGNVNAIYWAFVIALGAFAESKALDKQYGKQQNYLPGMLGFDPLGADSPGTRNAEILNGRVAMVAITIYAYQEALTKSAIFPINLFRPVEAVSGAVGGAVAAVVSAAADTPSSGALESLLAAADQTEELARGQMAAVAEPLAAVADAVGDAVADAAAAGAAVAGAAADAAGDAVGSGVVDAVGGM